MKMRTSLKGRTHLSKMGSSQCQTALKIDQVTAPKIDGMDAVYALNLVIYCTLFDTIHLSKT